MMEPFRGAGAAVHTTVMLGAGASTTSGLPDWDTFVTRLLRETNAVADDGVARLLLKKQDPLLVAEAAKAAAGVKWENVLRTALYRGVLAHDPSPLHRAAVGHLLSGTRGDTSLVTLNFDGLLETALQMEGQPAHSSTDGVAHASSWTVHHLHGLITPTATRDVVLTLTDFNGMLGTADPWQSRLLADAVRAGHLIIAGTSYRDPDVRHWLHQALLGKPADHSALVLLAREAFGLPKDDFTAISKPITDQWRAAGLTPVLLQEHSDAAQIIRELRYLHRPGYLAPQDRTRIMWAAHQAQFADLQQQYVDLLSDQAESLRAAIGDDDLNLSLWLANGEGQLVRWAAQDRIYRDPRALRGIETGHDSPWIVGQALAADSILYQEVESAQTSRWQTVLAIPVPIAHPDHPVLPMAVLTIGLANISAAALEGLKLIWGPEVAQIADGWADQISTTAYAPA